MVHDANLFDFRPLVLASALIVWTIWAFRVGRTRLGMGLAAIALLCQEDVGLLLAAASGYLALAGKRRQAFLLAGAGLLYFLLMIGLVLPHFRERPDLGGIATRRYGWLTHEGVGPLTIAANAFRPDRLRVPVYLLISGAAVGLRAWPVLLLALPQLLISALSQQLWPSRLTGTYYFIPCEVAVVLAVTLACARAPSGRSWRLGYLGGATLVLSVLLSPLPHGLGSSWANYSISQDRNVLAEAARLLPPEARLCVQKNLGSHVGHHRYVIMHPYPACQVATHSLFYLRDVGGPDSGLFTRTDGFMPYETTPGGLQLAVRGMLSSREWGLLFQRQGFYLFERGAPSRIPTEQALSGLRSDVRAMDEARGKALAHRWRLYRWFAGEVAWRDVW